MALTLSSSPTPPPDIDLDPNKLEFGRVFAPTWLSAHYEKGQWKDLTIEPMREIDLHPAAIVLHYGQAIFEGLKAYAWEDGSVRLFRPIENARRMNRSAVRMAMPSFDENMFVEGISALVHQQRAWVPKQPGSLYIRPTMIATEPCLGVRASRDFLFFVMTLPSGSYFPQTAGVTGPGSVNVFVTSHVGRAARGGTGHVKAAANYAVTLKIIEDGKEKGCSQVLFLDAAGRGLVEEMGGMNVFFVAGKTLMTPPLTDTILPGVTRMSILELAPQLGYEVVEDEISFKRICDSIQKGEVTEAFACGTAAVVVGIKDFILESRETVSLASAPGPATSLLYERLTAIQYGRAPDPLAWMRNVSDPA